MIFGDYWARLRVLRRRLSLRITQFRSNSSVTSSCLHQYRSLLVKTTKYSRAVPRRRCLSIRNAGSKPGCKCVFTMVGVSLLSCDATGGPTLELGGEDAGGVSDVIGLAASGLNLLISDSPSSHAFNVNVRACGVSRACFSRSATNSRFSSVSDC